MERSGRKIREARKWEVRRGSCGLKQLLNKEFSTGHTKFILSIREVSDDILSINISIVRTFISLFSPLLQTMISEEETERKGIFIQ